MKIQLIAVCFFLLFSQLQAQKGFVTELEYDSIYGIIRFKHINSTDSTIRVPAFDGLYNNYRITYPNGETVERISPTCNSDYWSLKPKQIVCSGGFFEDILEVLTEGARFNRKYKNVRQEMGIHKIEWIVEGQPTKTISIDYKGGLKDKIPRKK